MAEGPSVLGKFNKSTQSVLSHPRFKLLLLSHISICKGVIFDIHYLHKFKSIAVRNEFSAVPSPMGGSSPEVQGLGSESLTPGGRKQRVNLKSNALDAFSSVMACRMASCKVRIA